MCYNYMLFYSTVIREVIYQTFGEDGYIDNVGN